MYSHEEDQRSLESLSLSPLEISEISRILLARL